jgi:hypothetical protein
MRPKRTHFHFNLKPMGRQIVNQSKSGVAALKVAMPPSYARASGVSTYETL